MVMIQVVLVMNMKLYIQVIVVYKVYRWKNSVSKCCRDYITLKIFVRPKSTYDLPRELSRKNVPLEFLERRLLPSAWSWSLLTQRSTVGQKSKRSSKHPECLKTVGKCEVCRFSKFHSFYSQKYMVSRHLIEKKTSLKLNFHLWTIFGRFTFMCDVRIVCTKHCLHLCFLFSLRHLFDGHGIPDRPNPGTYYDLWNNTTEPYLHTSMVYYDRGHFRVQFGGSPELYTS